ncbi:MAG: hypothetical protein II816_06430, partial [Elusimicrobia bacterium]|nr:hypothetical protein [Elusimicrobiota bacterium]
MKTLKLIKRKLKENFSFTKFTAVFTMVCLITSVVCSQLAYATVSMPNIPVNTLSENSFPKTLIPFNIGKVTDAYFSNSDDIVINIQDLHSHEQTQRNISSILSILDSKFNIADIYLEGASGTVNTAWFANIKNVEKKQQILNNLLKSGKLTGAEYYAAQSKKDVTIKGLEDKTLYSKNFERLYNIFGKQTEVKNYLSILNNFFDEKSQIYYSKENKKINKIVQNYKAGKIKTDKYIELLLHKAQKTNINLSKYPAIINFAKIVSSKKSFNSENLAN